MTVQESQDSGQNPAYRNSDLLYQFDKYCMIKYRKIYEQHYGPIPRESDGKSYDIHHIDGDHKNHDPSNLKAITVQEHYDIHYAQGDRKACLIMTFRLRSNLETISELAKKTAQQQIENGTHNFLDGKISRAINQKRVEDGTHHLLGGEIYNGVVWKTELMPLV